MVRAHGSGDLGPAGTFDLDQVEIPRRFWRMTRSSRIVCALAVLLLPAVAATVARAEHTRFWREADYAEFRRATASGVALRSDGTFTPAPRLDSFADPGLAYLWALRSDAQGRL